MTATDDWGGRSVSVVTHADPRPDDLDQSAASTRARASTARPDTYCAYCGRRMGPGRHGRRRYCSNGCRQGAYKRRRAAEKSAAGVTDGN